MNLNKLIAIGSVVFSLAACASQTDEGNETPAPKVTTTGVAPENMPSGCSCVLWFEYTQCISYDCTGGGGGGGGGGGCDDDYPFCGDGECTARYSNCASPNYYETRTSCPSDCP